MIKNILRRKLVYTESWKHPQEFMDKMEQIKTAIENLRQDILKEIPVFIDYSEQIKELQINQMDTWKKFQEIEVEVSQLAMDINKFIDNSESVQVVVPEPQVVNKYFTKTVYYHNLWVYSAVATSIVLGILGLVF